MQKQAQMNHNKTPLMSAYDVEERFFSWALDLSLTMLKPPKVISGIPVKDLPNDASP